jgi:sugar phosphate isomerase/epimerase
MDKEKIINQMFKKLNADSVREHWAECPFSNKTLLSIDGFTYSALGNWESVNNFVRNLGMAGLEVRLEDLRRGSITISENNFPQKVFGVHLSDWAFWIDLWNNNDKRLNNLFKSPNELKEYFCGGTKEKMLSTLLNELELAKKLNAKYAVIHGINIDYEDILYGERYYSNSDVLRVVPEIINALLEKASFNGLILVENGSSYESGLVLENKSEIEILLEQIDDRRVGIIFDTCHKETHIQSINDLPVDKYLANAVSRLGPFKNKVQGMHLSDSSIDSFSFLLPERKKKQELKHVNNFSIQRKLAKEKIRKQDAHLPVGVLQKKPAELLSLVNPEYIIFELKMPSIEMLKKACIVQQAYILGLGM